MKDGYKDCQKHYCVPSSHADNIKSMNKAMGFKSEKPTGAMQGKKVSKQRMGNIAKADKY
jgi:hypothetical protein